ncbi:MAG: hypothetical protein AAF649_07560 [Verrucomicrobiota bacterium]
MKTLTDEPRSQAITRHAAARREQAETLVAMLTHFYIHLGMEEARAYRSALLDFELDYPAEVMQFRAALAVI